MPFLVCRVPRGENALSNSLDLLVLDWCWWVKSGQTMEDGKLIIGEWVLGESWHPQLLFTLWAWKIHHAETQCHLRLQLLPHRLRHCFICKRAHLYGLFYFIWGGNWFILLVCIFQVIDFYSLQCMAKMCCLQPLLCVLHQVYVRNEYAHAQGKSGHVPTETTFVQNGQITC